MVRLLDERIDKVYGSLLGPMKKKNIDKIRHFTLDVMVFILDTNLVFVINYPGNNIFSAKYLH